MAAQWFPAKPKHLGVWNLRGLERERCLASDVRRLDVCLALLTGRTPDNLVCVSGSFYQWSVQLTAEGGVDTAPLVTAQLRPITAIQDEGNYSTEYDHQNSPGSYQGCPWNESNGISNPMVAFNSEIHGYNFRRGEGGLNPLYAETLSRFLSNAGDQIIVPSSNQKIESYGNSSVYPRDAHTISSTGETRVPGDCMDVVETGENVQLPWTVEEGRMSADDQGNFSLTLAVPSVHEYSIRFLAVTSRLIILQTHAQTLDAKTTRVFHVDRLATDDVSWVSAMEEPELVSSAEGGSGAEAVGLGDLFLCRDRLRSPSAAWLWWPLQGEQLLVELSDFVNTPERIIIDGRPEMPLLYYITCVRGAKEEGYVTKYDWKKKETIIMDTILVSCDFLKLTQDGSLVVALQRHVVTFVTVCTNSMVLKHSIPCPYYCPLLSLPLSFPQSVTTYIESELATGIEGCVALTVNGQLSGLDAPDSCCFLLIPLILDTASELALVHISFADPKQVSQVQVHQLADYQVERTNTQAIDSKCENEDGSLEIPKQTCQSFSDITDLEDTNEGSVVL